MRKALLLTLVFSCLLAAFWYFGRSSFWFEPYMVYYLDVFFYLAYMWIPGIFALVFARKDNIKIRFFSTAYKELVWAFFLPIMLTALIILVSLLFASPSVIPFSSASIKSFLELKPAAQITSLSIFTIVFVGRIFILNVAFSMGEELMWRGFMLQKLKNFSLMKKSLIIGSIWGVWHAPLIVLFQHNYPSHPYIGILFMVLLCSSLTPIMIMLTEKAGNLYAPSLFHATINAISPLSLLIFYKASPFIIGITGVSGLIVMNLLNIGIYLQKKSSIRAST